MSKELSARSDYKFSQLLGHIYTQGDIVFSPSGTQLLSPVGCRVNVFDLVNHISSTLPITTQADVYNMAFSPDGGLLLVCDVEGGGVLINYTKRILLSTLRFKGKAHDLKFSPDGKYFAATCDNHVDIWKTPGPLKQYNPFVRYCSFYSSDFCTSIEWSADSNCVLIGAKDTSLAIYNIHPIPDSENLTQSERFDKFPRTRKPIKLIGHRAAIVACFFDKGEARIYSVCKTGSLFVWKYGQKPLEFGEEPPKNPTRDLWYLESKHFFSQNASVFSAQFHKQSNMVVVGFGNGIFGAWDLPSFKEIHRLNISNRRVRAVAINNSGEWFAFGIPDQSQLLVWEWQSERYVLKQQGHYFDMKCLAYGPQGRFVATGGSDGKVKIWKADDGFCFVTFTAEVTGIAFSANKQVVVTSSLDGTVRAFDLIRYRNFRIFTSPDPRQFSCVAIDASGEIVAAACADMFEIYVWDMQTGRLLDILEGHEGPVSSLAFNPMNGELASASWDHTVMIWDVFSGNKNHKDMFSHGTDVLCVAYRPDGKQLASSSMDGRINLWDPINGLQMGTIEGRNDVFTKKKSSKEKFFRSISYTADGECLLAGGDARYVMLYHVPNRLLLQKFLITRNKKYSGMISSGGKNARTSEGFLNTFKLDEFEGDGNILENKWEKRKSKHLPGVQAGYYSNKNKFTAKVTQVIFSPTGRQWSCTSSEGVLVYSLDDTSMFDPYLLDIDVTEKNIFAACVQGQYLKALVMGLRLNEYSITRRVFESIPPTDIDLVARDLHQSYLKLFLVFLARYMTAPYGSNETPSPHVHFMLKWTSALLFAHGQFFKQNASAFGPSFRALQKNMVQLHESLTSVENGALMDYLSTTSQKRDIIFPQKKGGSKDGEVQFPPMEEEAPSNIDTSKLPGWY